MDSAWIGRGVSPLIVLTPLFDYYMNPLQSLQQMTAWEMLNPKSFISTVYLRCLKISITPGSFILYHNKEEEPDAQIPRVGRILEVVDSIDKVPGSKNFPAIRECFQEEKVCQTGAAENDGEGMPSPYFVRVNVFKSRSLFSDRDFPVDDEILLSRASGGAVNAVNSWQSVVQLEEDTWILADAIINLSFVFPEKDVLNHGYDDCHGMHNFFVLGHRCAQNGRISPLPNKQACPPFPGELEGFFDYWSDDQCHALFHSIRHIARALQRLLCRIAQSQGDFSNRNARLQVPRYCWFYLKSQFEEQGISVVSGVQFCQPRPILGWGLTYHCIRETGNLEILRFDTSAKMKAFRKIFGHTSGYGVRKKRPRYIEGQAMLNLNDVINVVHFSANDEVNDNNGREHCAGSTFQRYGVMEDGIDLVYDVNDCVLQVVVRYRKVIVTKESIPFLRAAGVIFRGGGRDDNERSQGKNVNAVATEISSGMEFIDSGYLMRVTSVTGNVVYARKTYRLVGDRSVRVYGSDNDIAYTNIVDINNRIQEMLD